MIMAKRFFTLSRKCKFLSHSLETLYLIDASKKSSESDYDDLHGNLIKHNRLFYQKFFSATVQAEKYNIGDITLRQLIESLHENYQLGGEVNDN